MAVEGVGKVGKSGDTVLVVVRGLTEKTQDVAVIGMKEVFERLE